MKMLKIIMKAHSEERKVFFYVVQVSGLKDLYFTVFFCMKRSYDLLIKNTSLL